MKYILKTMTNEHTPNTIMLKYTNKTTILYKYFRLLSYSPTLEPLYPIFEK